MKHVAALAGVGIKTVSRVINGEPNVSAATIERVQAAASQLQYQPDLHAGNLRRSNGRTNTLGLLVGIVLGVVFQPEVPLGLEPYLPIAVVAALDAVFGGLRAYLDGIFDDKVFVVSFVSNVVIAATIVYLGDQLGVGGQLSTGVIVVLGIRIFSNVAAIRRHLFHA